MESPFPPFDPGGEDSHESPADSNTVRLRDIPLRAIFPNLLTLLAICSGLTSIRFAIEGRIELAVGAIIFAGFLDGIDGRVARFLKSTSRFGAEMDSLADFVNFGVAPSLLLYFTILQDVHSMGWIAALIYVSCACMRLARFNVMLDSHDLPDWHKRFFVGVPAPAGALLVLLPVYIDLLGGGDWTGFEWGTTFLTTAVGFMMVSNIATFSGKDVSEQINRNLVMPFMIVAVFLTALVITYPWVMLSVLAVLYMASIPFSFMNYQRYLGDD